MRYGIRTRTGVALTLALLQFFSAAFGSQAESSFWAERRRASLGAHPRGRSSAQGQTPLPRKTVNQIIPKGSRAAMVTGLSDRARGNCLNLEQIVDPEGMLTESSLGPKGGPFVYIIQDLHGSPAVQKRVKSLVEKLGVALIGVEGAAGAFDLSAYRQYPYPSSLNRLAEEFVERGWFTGVEWAGLTAPQAPLLFGVEDPSLYRNNIRALVAGHGAPKSRQKAAELNSRIAALLAGRTSPDLKFWMEISRNWAAGNRALSHFLWTLKSQKIDLNTFPQTARLLKTLGGGTGEGPPPSDAAGFLNLAEIPFETLVQEFSTLQEVVERKLAQTEEDRFLCRLFHDGELLEKLTSFKLTYANWENFKKRRLDIIRLPGIVAERDGHDIAPGLAEDWAPYESFFDAAADRNAVMIRNLLAEMSARETTTALLVAGGFHTPGLTAALKNSKVSYAVITPRFQGISVEDDPLEVFFQTPPLEKTGVSGVCHFLNPTPALASHLKDMEVPGSESFRRAKAIRSFFEQHLGMASPGGKSLPGTGATMYWLMDVWNKTIQSQGKFLQKIGFRSYTRGEYDARAWYLEGVGALIVGFALAGIIRGLTAIPVLDLGASLSLGVFLLGHGGDFFTTTRHWNAFLRLRVAASITSLAALPGLVFGWGPATFIFSQMILFSLHYLTMLTLARFYTLGYAVVEWTWLQKNPVSILPRGTKIYGDSDVAIETEGPGMRGFWGVIPLRLRRVDLLKKEGQPDLLAQDRPIFKNRFIPFFTLRQARLALEQWRADVTLSDFGRSQAWVNKEVQKLGFGRLHLYVVFNIFTGQTHVTKEFHPGHILIMQLEMDEHSRTFAEIPQGKLYRDIPGFVLGRIMKSWLSFAKGRSPDVWFHFQTDLDSSDEMPKMPAWVVTIIKKSFFFSFENWVKALDHWTNPLTHGVVFSGSIGLLVTGVLSLIMAGGMEAAFVWGAGLATVLIFLGVWSDVLNPMLEDRVARLTRALAVSAVLGLLWGVGLLAPLLWNQVNIPILLGLGGLGAVKSSEPTGTAQRLNVLTLARISA